MGQEYFINSQTLQAKISQLLPTQGGAGPGQDLSASTQIIPIIDLTESASGANVREDIQKAFSHANTTFNLITNTTTVLTSTTGYWRCFGNVNISYGGTSLNCRLEINDGSTSKTVYRVQPPSYATGTTTAQSTNFDFLVYLTAGDSLQGVVSTTAGYLSVAIRQVADIDGNLIPSS